MYDRSDIQNIENAYLNINNISDARKQECKSSVDKIWQALDSGELAVAEKIDGDWVIDPLIKKAILLGFCIRKCSLNDGSYDKIPLKFTDWTAEDFARNAVRAVPGSIVRYSAFIGKNTVLMPSFINVGARIGAGTMVDAWSTIGSCAQIGENCHISGGVGIGGTLEPAQNLPVIIEENCFIGARSEIAEGVLIEEGSVIGMGVYLGSSTKIIDRKTGQIFKGKVPKGSVVVAGSYPSDNCSIACAVIVKQVDAATRKKTKIEELLRD